MNGGSKEELDTVVVWKTLVRVVAAANRLYSSTLCSCLLRKESVGGSGATGVMSQGVQNLDEGGHYPTLRKRLGKDREPGCRGCI